MDDDVDDKTILWVSPTERPAVRHALANRFDVQVSSIPERRGVDFCWRANERWFGVQRKTADDFNASVSDGRLAREIAQMRAGITMPFIVIEGRMNNSALRVTEMTFTQRQFTVMSAGVSVMHSRDIGDTARVTHALALWSERAEHHTAMAIPKATGDWGKPSNADWQRAVLMQLPGVGAKTAQQIVKLYGVPLTLTVTEDELLEVPGIGPRIAKRILDAFGMEE